MGVCSVSVLRSRTGRQPPFSFGVRKYQEQKHLLPIFVGPLPWLLDVATRLVPLVASSHGSGRGWPQAKICNIHLSDVMADDARWNAARWLLKVVFSRAGPVQLSTVLLIR